MTPKKFGEIWNLCSKTINSLIAEDGRLFLLADAEKHLRKTYETLRKQYKTNTAKNPDGLYDQHKVAALMAKAVLDVQPIQSKIPKSARVPLKLRLANQLLAFDIAIITLWSEVIAALRNSGQTDDAELADLMLDLGLKLPRCNHGSYRVNLAMAFWHTTWIKSPDKFSMLFLADILFHLEEHNITFYRLIQKGIIARPTNKEMDLEG